MWPFAVHSNRMQHRGLNPRDYCEHFLIQTSQSKHQREIEEINKAHSNAAV